MTKSVPSVPGKGNQRFLTPFNSLIFELTFPHSFFQRGEGDSKASLVVLDHDRFNDDVSEEVSEHPFGSDFGTIHCNDAKSLRTDVLYPVLNDSCRPAKYRGTEAFRSTTFSFCARLTSCNHPNDLRCEKGK